MYTHIYVYIYTYFTERSDFVARCGQERLHRVGTSVGGSEGWCQCARYGMDALGVNMRWAQGGEDSLIFIRHFPQKWPIFSGSLWKMICNLGDPMSLRHPGGGWICGFWCEYIYICRCICVYWNTHTCIYDIYYSQFFLQKRPDIFILVWIFMYICIDIHEYWHLYLYNYLWEYAYVYMNMCTYIYIHIHIYIYIYIYVYICTCVHM